MIFVFFDGNINLKKDIFEKLSLSPSTVLCLYVYLFKQHVWMD